jgi:hypothetical protein
VGFRFRRTIKIAPGVRINLSKSGPSVSVGPRGAKVTVGHGRARATVGLPGTGLSYTAVSSSTLRPAPAVQASPASKVAPTVLAENAQGMVCSNCGAPRAAPYESCRSCHQLFRDAFTPEPLSPERRTAQLLRSTWTGRAYWFLGSRASGLSQAIGAVILVVCLPAFLSLNSYGDSRGPWLTLGLAAFVVLRWNVTKRYRRLAAEANART